ncbi:MAG: YIP1 family protein [Verrucomicrobiia bacterium]
MIKALLLITKPLETWESILLGQRSVLFLLVRYLFPMMLLAAVAEGFGLMAWGRPQTGIHRIHIFALGETVVYEMLRSLLLLLVVVICAALIKMFGETFRRRHTYRQTFTLVIFGLSPLFLLRLLDAAPGINPCITWAIGIVLCLEVVYQGIPRVMEPDPPNAIGLFFMSALALLAVTGLERFVTYWYLSGHTPPIQSFISSLAAKLPF